MTQPSPWLILKVFEWLGRLFPAPPLDSALTASPELFEQRRRHWNRVGGIAFASICCLVAVGGSLAACVAASRHLAHLGTPLFLIRAEPFELCVWVTFLALAIAPGLTFLLLRLVLGQQRYAEFHSVACHASALGGPGGVVVHLGKVFTLFALVGGLPLVALIVGRIDNYTAFQPDTMNDNPLGSLWQETTRPYQTLRGIYAVARFHARFEDQDKPRHALQFADGTLWTTDAGLRAPRPEADQQFIEEISRQSGLPVTPVDFLEDIPR